MGKLKSRTRWRRIMNIISNANDFNEVVERIIE